LESIGTGDGFHSKLLKSNITWEKGFVYPPDAPGLGVELDEAVARENPYIWDDLHLSMSNNEHLR
jgi:L-alanine-DL-glutamate epimerase-like enolase superfamily enzyme